MQHPPGAQQQDWFVSHEPTISQVVRFIKKGQRSGGGRPGPLLEGRVRIVKILFFAAVGPRYQTNRFLLAENLSENPKISTFLSLTPNSALIFLLPLLYMRANRESFKNQEKSSSTPFFMSFRVFAILAAA